MITVTGRAPALPPLIAAHAYRIGSEAITNALRHADAATIDVRIDADGRVLRLRVSDDGRGLPDRAPPGRQRAVRDGEPRRHDRRPAGRSRPSRRPRHRDRARTSR